MEVVPQPTYQDLSATKQLAATPALVVAEHFDLAVELVPFESSRTPVIWHDEFKTGPAGPGGNRRD